MELSPNGGFHSLPILKFHIERLLYPVVACLSSLPLRRRIPVFIIYFDFIRITFFNWRVLFWGGNSFSVSDIIFSLLRLDLSFQLVLSWINFTRSKPILLFNILLLQAHLVTWSWLFALHSHFMACIFGLIILFFLFLINFR